MLANAGKIAKVSMAIDGSALVLLNIPNFKGTFLDITK